MAYSSTPPHNGVRSMLLVFLMEAIVYSLYPLLHSSTPPLLLFSSSPHGGARVALPLFLNHDTA